MLKKTAWVALLLLTAVIYPLPAAAQQEPSVQGADLLSFLAVGLTLFWPIGLILLISSAMPEERAPRAAVQLLAGWSLASLAYFGVGFALQFGGIAQVTTDPDLRGLYWEWYPLDQSVAVEVARLWGVIALRGWALAGEAATPGALRLFLSHVALVGVAALIPTGTLLARGRGWAALWASIVSGGLIYPVAGNWLWGGGWLAHAGLSLNLGHGLVDFGGASAVFLAGSGVALAGLVIFRPEIPLQAEQTEDVEKTRSDPAADGDEIETALLPPAPMPSAYLPLLSTLGGGLLLLGWLGLSSGLHAPTALDLSPSQAGVGGLLAGLSGALTAAAYSGFATRTIDPLMTARGLTAGLIVAVAGAPFAPIWVFVLAGLLMGLLTPLLIYFFERRLILFDSLGAITTYGVSAVISLLLVGLLADGQAGQGWNGPGPDSYGSLGARGVSGLLAYGSGQLQAQLLGGGVIILWALLVSVPLFQLLRLSERSRERISIVDAEPEPAPSPSPPANYSAYGDDPPEAETEGVASG